MVQNETTEGFVVFDLPTEEVRKPKKRKAAKKVVKRSPGRPPVYTTAQRRTVASFLKKHGLTVGIKRLASDRKLKVSLTLARSVAEEYGVKFERGRPKAA